MFHKKGDGKFRRRGDKTVDMVLFTRLGVYNGKAVFRADILQDGTEHYLDFFR